jgi:hypothetical protein
LSNRRASLSTSGQKNWNLWSGERLVANRAAWFWLTFASNTALAL